MYNSSKLLFSVQFSSVQSLSRVWLFATPWITTRQASLSITTSQSSLRLTSIESVMPSSHLILCRPLLLLTPILPASKSFPMSQLFTWGGQSIAVSASASVLPKNTQDWSPLEWIGWISLQSKGLSRVFSNTTVQKCQFFSAQLSSGASLVAQRVKRLPACNAGDLDSIPGLGRSSGEGNGNSPQYSCLENLMDGAW